MQIVSGFSQIALTPKADWNLRFPRNAIVSLGSVVAIHLFSILKSSSVVATVLGKNAQIVFLK